MLSAWWSMVWITSPAILWSDGERPPRVSRWPFFCASCAGKTISLPITKNLRFHGSHPPQKIRAPKGSGGRPESPLVASAETKNAVLQEKARKAPFPCLPDEIYFLWSPSVSTGGCRRFPKGDRKALWSPPQRRNLLRNRKECKGSFPCLPQEIYFFVVLIRFNRVGPEGFQRATGKTFGRLRRGEIS